ncbi:unnamed protein product [Blumeria hordei]|uniref:FHA domain-containing protein n=1 Tax=Blumeria hordei TaxID=2867405 RepID=A0A383V1Z6_BLUHO|nr:unnamed protein product [Blumeria hordei]
MDVKVSLTLTVLNNDSIFPAIRVITLCPKNPSIVVGRASRSPNKALYCATDNAWLDSPVISRDHAIITLDSKRQSLTLQDTDSLHGTRLNDFQMTSFIPANLYNGDNVTFGAEVKRGSKIFAACTLQVKFDFFPYMETSNFELFESSDSDNRFSQNENDEDNDISEFISRIGRGFTKASLNERLKAISATESSGAVLYSNNQNNFYGDMNHRSQLGTHQNKKSSLKIKKNGIQVGTSICDIKSCTNSSAIIREKNDCQFSSDSFPRYLGDINTGLCNSEMFELPNTIDLRNKDISIVPFSQTNNIDNSLDARSYLDRSTETRALVGTTSSNESQNLLCYRNSRYKLSRNSLDDNMVSYHQISPQAGDYKHEDRPHLNRTFHEYPQSKSVLASKRMTSSPSMTLLASPQAEYFSPSSWEKSSYSDDVPFLRAANRNKNISKSGTGCVNDSKKRWSRILDDSIDKSFYFKAREFNKAHFHSMTRQEKCTPFQQVQPGIYQQDRNSGNLQASCRGYNYVSLAPTLCGDDKKSSDIDNSITKGYLSIEKSQDSKSWNHKPSLSPLMNNIKSCRAQQKSLVALSTKDTQAKNVLEINEASNLESMRQSDGTKRKFRAISGDNNREQEICSQPEVLLRESDENSNKVSEPLEFSVKTDGRPKKRQRYLERFGYAALGGFAAAAGLFSLLVTTAPEFS